MTVVDIHTHTFNAEDIPVRGFVQRLFLKKVNVGGQLSRLVDVLIQGAAPGFEEENAKLDNLLARSELGSAYGVESAEPAPTVTPQFQAEVDAAFDALSPADLALLEQVTVAVLEADGESVDVRTESLRDWVGAPKRLVAFVSLFGRFRVDNTRLLIENFDDQVDLFCPMLVDLAAGLGDTPRTTMAQQIVLHEKISRLSMVGRLPGVKRARIHPFVAFDPRREVHARLVGDIGTPFDTVKRAIMEYGFVGVKLYPPMGFKPIGNEPTVGMTLTLAEKTDEVLREFYSWCQNNQVPITAHCNQSNYSDKKYEFFASPENWIKVLEEFPGLHVNLGHFGGTADIADRTRWPWIGALATARFDHLYADVGNHNVHDEAVANAYLDGLAGMFSDATAARMKQRIMYGSDWYIVASHPEHDQFLTNYRDIYLARFHQEATDLFMGGNALRFLGFDDANNANTVRLRVRYEQYAPADRYPDWLAGA